MRVRGGGGQVEEILPVKPYALQETQLTLEKNGNWEVLKIRKVYFHVIWEGEKSAAEEMLPAPEVSGGGAAIDYKPTPVININLLSVNI